MALGTDDGKTACLLDFRRKLDVRTTTSHVGGNGDGTQSVGRLTSQCHDVCLLLVELGIQHLVGNTLALARLGVDIHIEHTAEQFRNLNRCSTYQRRATSLAQAHHLVDDGTVLFTGCLIDTVVHIVADNRTVGRNLHHVELIDIPELASLGRSRTGHTSQLVVHTEIVLKGDGGKGLGGSLYLHVLLGFDSLVQSVAPAASLHDTTRLLIDNLHFAVDDHILVVLVEHGVGLQQLLQGMHTLRLHGIVLEHFIFLVQALLVRQARVSLQFRELTGNIGQHEELGIVDLLGQPSRTLIGEVAGVQLLVNHEVEGLHHLGHTAVVVLHIDILGGLHTRLDTFLGQELDEGLVLRQTLMRTVECQEAFFLQFLVVLLAALGNLLLSLCQILRSQLALHTHNLLNQGLILLEHLVVALGHRTGDDEWGTGIVNQHGVNLIDDGVVMSALHKVLR